MGWNPFSKPKPAPVSAPAPAPAETGSRQTAKERLKMTIAYDRGQVSQAKMAQLKEDLYEVFRRHDLDPTNLELAIEPMEDTMNVHASVPLNTLR